MSLFASLAREWAPPYETTLFRFGGVFLGTTSLNLMLRRQHTRGQAIDENEVTKQTYDDPYLKSLVLFPWSTDRVFFRYLVACGIFSSLSSFGYHVALYYMTLADVNTLFFTVPVYSTILGRIFLKESITLSNVISIILALAGAICICRPEFVFGHTEGDDEAHYSGRWKGVLITFAACTFAATYVILVRKIILSNRAVHPTVVVFYIAVSGFCWSIIGMITQQGFSSGTVTQWLTIVGVIATSLLGQLLWNAAIQREKASIGTILRYACEGVFSFVWSITVLHETLPLITYIGATLVISALVIILVHKTFHETDTKGKLLEESTDEEADLAYVGMDEEDNGL
jgi:drug/metabolite transporter (DMT)-like permease